ncbi:SEM3D protein, partial [Fregetta grallaria]|nr:SEM3D protein [Fregetta grallaria]
DLLKSNSSRLLLASGDGLDFQALLVDEDRAWLMVGAKNHIFLLHLDHPSREPEKIFWPASREQVEHCQLAGKNVETECANFIRLLQPFNRSHVFACGTGSYQPVCAFIQLGARGKGPGAPPMRLVTHSLESGRGRCPYSPHEPFTGLLVDGELYSGTSSDFMGSSAAFFRTWVHGAEQSYIRTEQNQDHWLHEPAFVGAYAIPDTYNPHDDKVYIFFRETAMEAGQWERRHIHARVARVCKVSHQRPAWLPWVGKKGRTSTQLGEEGPPAIPLLSLPLAHQPNCQTTRFGIGTAVVPQARLAVPKGFLSPPGCHARCQGWQGTAWAQGHGVHVPVPHGAAGTLTAPCSPRSGLSPGLKAGLPWAGLPSAAHLEQGQPRLPARNGRSWDQGAGPGPWHTGPLAGWGTQKGPTRLQHPLLPFQVPSPILDMKLSPKRQELFVSSTHGLLQLSLYRCELYGKTCTDCCLARDPYCTWDSKTCAPHLLTEKRRARCQDVLKSDPLSQCQDTAEGTTAAEKLVFGVEKNSTFLECLARSPQTTIRWLVRHSEETGPSEVQGTG